MWKYRRSLLEFLWWITLESKLDIFVWSKSRATLGGDATLSRCRFECIFVSLCVAYSRSPPVLLDTLPVTAASSRSAHFHLCSHPANPVSNARLRKSKVCQGKKCNWRNVSRVWNLMHRPAVSEAHHSGMAWSGRFPKQGPQGLDLSLSLFQTAINI